MNKPFTIAFIKDLESQYLQELITYSRMVELLNEKAIKWSNDILQVKIEGAIHDAFNIGVYRESFGKDAEWGKERKRELLQDILTPNH